VDPGLTGPVRIACYPSPAVSFANISVAGAGGWQSLKIYDVQGRVVRDAGASEGRDFRWDLTDESGTRVSPGIYFVAVAASGSSATHKLMIVR
jgi:flagellar hook assembly protein FlgD